MQPNRLLKNLLSTVDRSRAKRKRMELNQPAGCSKRPDGQAAASEEARRALCRTLSL